MHRHLVRSVVLMLVLVLAGPGGRAAAVGAAPAEVFEEFGLIGTWSPDCTRPPSQFNPRVRFRAVGGSVAHTVTFDGRTIALADQVGQARQIAPDTLLFTVVRAGQVFATVTLRREYDMIHSERSVSPDGHVFVDHGIDQVTGLPTLADEMCSASIS